MNKDQLHGAMDNLSKILGYTAPEGSSTTESIDEYDKAAERIKDHILTSGLSYPATDEELQALYEEFQDRFSPEKLKEISDDQLLRTLFYTTEGTNDSLCYWLEFNPKIREHFGSIAGGSSFKFGLFQKKDTGVWVTGGPRNPEELTETGALALGKQIRDMIVRGADIIRAAGELQSASDYEKLDVDLNAAIGKYAFFAWIHKYYHMIFPGLFCTWHASDLQRHMLYGFGIKPSQKYYGRSGQLAIIARKAALRAPAFANAAYDLFGDIRQFIRIGTSSDNIKYAEDWQSRSIVAIGWNGLGSLTEYEQDNSLNQSAVQAALMEHYYQEDARTASRKAGEIALFYSAGKNSVFVPMDGEQLLALCDDTGSYGFEDGSVFAHLRPVKWHRCFSKEDKLPNKGEGLRTTCVQIKDPDNLLYLYDKYYGITDAGEIQEEEKAVEQNHTPRVAPLYPLNMILYGAPGTGKTYSAVEYAVSIIENTPFVLSNTASERQARMTRYQELVDSGRIVFTTFHQNYGYEEFIQGIRPQITADRVGFRIADGVFKKIADKAMQDPANHYVIIIDEINRGNISKIFGELITLIEEDKRWGEVNQLKATLPLGDTFAVPNNLFIIGTMNTADKSISLIDVALRRRFDFIGMYPDLNVIADDTLRQAVERLNGFLRVELNGSDLLIGHSFFVNRTAGDLGEIMNKNIIPLLYEYFFDEEPKVRKALECLVGTGFIIDPEASGRISVKRNTDERV